MSDILLPPGAMRRTRATQQNMADVLESHNAELARFADQVEGAAEAYAYFCNAMQQFARRHGLRPQNIVVDNPRVVDNADGAEFRMAFRRKGR